MGLSIQSIVQTALNLLNAEGLEALTTRRLAEMLGVKQPALYKHVSSKQELLGEMVATMLSAGLAEMKPCDDWVEWLRQFGRLYRVSLLRYRDGARMLAASSPSERTRRDVVQSVYQPLLAAGFTRVDAMRAEGLIAAFVLGWVIYEQNEGIHSVIAADASTDVLSEAAFAEDLDMILRSIELRRRRPS